jgi:hypothetical protein
MNKLLLTALAISWRVDYDEKGGDENGGENTPGGELEG